MEENNKELTNSIPQVRRIWYNHEWYYSVVDIISVLTGSANPRDYWNKIKKRTKTEGFDETSTLIVQMKLKAADGRFRLTDIANRQTLLRIIQSVPSPKAESVRIWLAQVGEERLEEIEHPEAALERVRGIYKNKGYNDSWIEERLKNDLIRNELTDEWKTRGVQKGVEFAILTNTLSEGTFGISIQAHKRYKLLPTKTNLRDHMTPMELALCSISEATSITFHRKRESQGFPELKRDTVDAGSVGNQVRELIEKSIGESVVSQENYLALKKVKSESQKGQLPVKKDKNLTLFDGLDSNQG